MAKLTKDELESKINTLEISEDDKIILLEDIEDSFEVEDTSEKDSEIESLKEEVESWKKKYKDRFLEKTEKSEEKSEEEKEEEFKEDEVIDVREI